MRPTDSPKNLVILLIKSEYPEVFLRFPDMLDMVSTKKINKLFLSYSLRKRFVDKIIRKAYLNQKAKKYFGI